MGVLKKIFSNEDLASTSASAVATPLSYFQEDENARAWGDELSGELLYTILLKRVRYSKNTGDGLQWETQKVFLRSTLVKSLPISQKIFEFSMNRFSS